ncbi:MAG: DUF559 domain-containing protein [Gammaproteobacteria bacterium]|nr:MAG: DUF559 domain-containing protein [Gammaproteobacteria bacterium]
MDIRQNVRQLRRKSTDAERRLWSHIRNRRLNNWKFRRQISIDHYRRGNLKVQIRYFFLKVHSTQLHTHSDP